MQLESYFEFLGEDDIRIRGTRVGIETVLEDYLEGSSPEEVAARYRSLSLEQVYATITYYWRNQKSVVTRIPRAFGRQGYYVQGDQLVTLPELFRQVNQDE